MVCRDVAHSNLAKVSSLRKKTNITQARDRASGWARRYVARYPPRSLRRRRLFHRCAAKTTNSSGGQPTLRMAVVSVWSLEEDTLKATFT